MTRANVITNNHKMFAPSTQWLYQRGEKIDNYFCSALKESHTEMLNCRRLDKFCFSLIGWLGLDTLGLVIHPSDHMSNTLNCLCYRKTGMHNSRPVGRIQPPSVLYPALVAGKKIQETSPE